MSHESEVVNIEEKKQKFVKAMQEFLDFYEWSDSLKINEDLCQVFLNAGLRIGSQSGKIFIELNYDNDIVDVYIYYGFLCKKEKSDEITKLFNMIHLLFALGRFELLPDGHIRWRHRVDFEGSVLSGTSIVAIVRPGWHCTETFVEPMLAVALTDQSAAQAMAAFDEARAKQAAQHDSAG